MVKKKKASKRIGLRLRANIKKKVSNHQRKLRKVAALTGKKAKKDPGIPNLWPWKEALLSELEDSRQEDAAAKAAGKAKQRKDAEKRRRQEMVAKAAVRASEVKASMGPQPDEEKEDGFFLGSVQIKEQGAVKRHWYFKELKKVVNVADVILEVLDARDPMGCRCLDVEKMVQQATNPDGSASKRIILILNKIDLVPSEVVGKWIRYLRRFFPTLAFKASTQKQRGGLTQFKGKMEDATDEQLAMASCIGAQQLLGLLKNYSRTVGGGKKTISVGVIGFPNVGKSSIINSLKRSRAVAVGSTPGLTKSLQQVRLDKSITLVDSPGVLFGSEDDKTLVLRNCLRVEQMEDPCAAVGTILERVHPEKMMTLYRLPRYTSTDDFLVLLANKMGKIGRGGIPNLKLAARQVLQDWNNAKIPFYTLPPVVQDITSSEVVTQFAREFDISNYEEQTSEDLRLLAQSQASNPVPASKYVVLESGQGYSMEGGDPADDEPQGMDEEEEDGTTVGVKRIQLRDDQTNRNIKLSQKKAKKNKKRARAAALAAMQQEADALEMEEDDMMGQQQQQQQATNNGDDYDFSTDWC